MVLQAIISTEANRKEWLQIRFFIYYPFVHEGRNGGKMFIDLQVGNLIEPLTGRTWDRRPYGVNITDGSLTCNTTACRIRMWSSCIMGIPSNFSWTFWQSGASEDAWSRSIPN